MKLSLIAALLLASSASAAAETIAITGGTVALGDGSEPIPGGMVVIRDGRIVAAGDIRMKLPADTRVIDATGKWVTPGIVAGFTRLGLAEIDLGGEGADDSSTTGPFSAAIDVAPSVNPLASTISVNRADGVTRALVAPGTERSIFAGQGAVIDTARTWIRSPRREIPVRRARRDGAQRAGGSRSSAHVLFRNALREASELSRYDQPIRGGGGGRVDERDRPVIANPNESRLYRSDVQRSEDILLNRFDAAALVPVLKGRQHLLVHVERASDILAVLGLKREFPSLKIVLVGVSEGWLVADAIARAGVPVIASPVNDFRPRSNGLPRPSRTSDG